MENNTKRGIGKGLFSGTRNPCPYNGSLLFSGYRWFFPWCQWAAAWSCVTDLFFFLLQITFLLKRHAYRIRDIRQYELTLVPPTPNPHPTIHRTTQSLNRSDFLVRYVTRHNWKEDENFLPCLVRFVSRMRYISSKDCLVEYTDFWRITLILRRSRTGMVWFYTSTSNKRAARPKLYTKSLTRDLKRMYSRFTLVRISVNL